MAVVILFLHRRLSQLRPLLIYLFTKPLRIDTGRLCHLFLLVFLLVGACLDVRPVYEYHAAVHHMVVQRFIQDMFKDFYCQFFREPPAERIAYRRKCGSLSNSP